MRKRWSIGLLLAVLLAGIGQAKGAILLDMERLEANAPVNIESQLSVAIDGVSGQASFEVMNEGPEPSFIDAIYIDDSAGVLDFGSAVLPLNWSPIASPAHLPGGGSVGFDTSFSTDADPSAAKNGIRPGESLEFLFSLTGGFGDVVTALASQELRVGMKVQGIRDKYSDTFVSVVPEPCTAIVWFLLASFGITVRWWWWRRRRAGEFVAFSGSCDALGSE